jgi:hypothetical protein
MVVVLDPRRKWHYIEFFVKEKYVDASILTSLRTNMDTLFDTYQKSMPKKEKESKVSSSTSSGMASGESRVEMDIDEIMKRRFEMTMGSSETSFKKTELDKYLGEEREPDTQFDILQWWKVQQCRYPVLAKMARDVLAIPVSTVASESAFSTGGRVLDCFRTSLTPRMVEALVCAQDWFRGSNNPIIIEDTLLEIEKMEAEG